MVVAAAVGVEVAEASADGKQSESVAAGRWLTLGLFLGKRERRPLFVSANGAQVWTRLGRLLPRARFG